MLLFTEIAFDCLLEKGSDIKMSPWKLHNHFLHYTKGVINNDNNEMSDSCSPDNGTVLSQRERKGKKNNT